MAAMVELLQVWVLLNTTVLPFVGTVLSMVVMLSVHDVLHL